MVERLKTVIKNNVPITTCAPWNPVSMKKAVPKVESLIEKKEELYSRACKSVKAMPRAMVTKRAKHAFIKLPSIKKAWLTVRITPEDRSKSVLTNGTLKQLKDWTERGGQFSPVSIDGDI